MHFAQELQYALGSLASDVQPDFSHHLTRHGGDGLGVQAGTVDLEPVAGMLAEQRLGHLAAAGIAGAQEENPRFGVHGTGSRLGSHDHGSPSGIVANCWVVPQTLPQPVVDTRHRIARFSSPCEVVPAAFLPGIDQFRLHEHPEVLGYGGRR